MLTKLQQFIQDRILLSIYPLCSIEEAREMELSKLGCIVIDKLHCFFGVPAPEKMIKVYGEEDCSEDEGYCFLHYRGNPLVNEKINNLIDNEKYDIIGLPPSLPRVLHCLGDKFTYIKGNLYNDSHDYRKNGIIGDIMSRKLLNEDGTDATLRDQSEESQKDIGLLLGWKDE